MRVTIELHRHDYATVIFTPSLVERLISRRQQQRDATRMLSIRGANAWHWLDGTAVTGQAARELDNAHRELLVQRVTPPG